MTYLSFKYSKFSALLQRLLGLVWLVHTKCVRFLRRQATVTDFGSNFAMVFNNFCIVRPVSMMSSTIRMFLPRIESSMFSIPMIFTSEKLGTSYKNEK